MTTATAGIEKMEEKNGDSSGLCFRGLRNHGLKSEDRQDHRDRYGDRAKWPGGAGVFRVSQSLPTASSGDSGTDGNPRRDVDGRAGNRSGDWKMPGAVRGSAAVGP